MLLRKFQLTKPSTNSVTSWTISHITCPKILKQSQLIRLWRYDSISGPPNGNRLNLILRYSSKNIGLQLIITNTICSGLSCMSLRVHFFLFSILCSGNFGTCEVWPADVSAFEFSSNYSVECYVIRVLWVVK